MCPSGSAIYSLLGGPEVPLLLRLWKAAAALPASLDIRLQHLTTAVLLGSCSYGNINKKTPYKYHISII